MASAEATAAVGTGQHAPLGLTVLMVAAALSSCHSIPRLGLAFTAAIVPASVMLVACSIAVP